MNNSCIRHIFVLTLSRVNDVVEIMLILLICHFMYIDIYIQSN